MSFAASDVPADHQAVRLAYHATRALLRANDTESAQAIIIRLCERMGARVVPAEPNAAAELPIDISLDGGEPLVLAADSPAVQSLVTTFVVPAVADARLLLRARTSQQMLTNDATRDALTGVWNRRSLELAINRASQFDSLALVDLDHFKAVNDNYGHHAGDEVLAFFAAFVRSRLRQRDIVGRLGGEEFVVIFPDTCVAEASRILCRLQTDWVPVAPYGTTFSAGVAAVRPEHDSAGQRAGQAALASADMLMYQAKSGGRNLVVTQDSDESSGGGGL